MVKGEPVPGFKPDLKPTGFPKDLDWKAGDSEAALGDLYDFVIKECDSAISWYYTKKNSKKRLGLWLRSLAILSVGVAGLIPLLSELLTRIQNRAGQPVFIISPGWATVALAVAGFLIALDRFGGYTSGWVRYVRTAQALTRLKGDFHLDWEALHRERQLPPADPEQVKTAILLCKQFLQAVYEQLRLETELWAREFQQALSAVENNAGSAIPATPGTQPPPQEGG
jgi:hypothetical protein